MAQNARGAAQQRITRSNASLQEVENKTNVMAAKGGLRQGPAPKAGLPKAGASVTHRRALSEVGNLVDLKQQNRDKENCIPAGKVAAVKAALHKRNSSIQVDNGLPAKPPAGQNSRWGSKGIRTVTSATATSSLEAVIAAEAKIGRVRSTSAASTLAEDAAMAVARHAAEIADAMDHDHPVADVPGHARSKSAAAIAVVPLVKKADENEICAMSLTSSLTAYSEEACGEVDMMEAEETLPDIDWEDRTNHLHETEYVEDIYAFYRRTEKEGMVSSTYMSQQKDVNDKMRSILIDWLIEVHLKFKLVPETLYLTINLIDRYLAITAVTRRNLQLVGVTAMLVASKYEEIWAPEVKDFVYISDNAYTRDQILATEKHMLNSLKFNLTVPTPYVFAARFIKAAAATMGSSPTEAQAANKASFTVVWYLLELCMMDYGMLKYPPSLMAAAAVYTALLRKQQAEATPSAEGSASTVTGTASSQRSQSPWTKLMERHSGYNEKQLLPCVEEMVQLQLKAPTQSLKAVYKKYSTAKLHEVARFPPAQVAQSTAGSTEVASRPMTPVTSTPAGQPLAAAV